MTWTKKKYAVPFILVKGVLFKEERPHTVLKPNLKSKNSETLTHKYTMIN